jgi:hypothetical protein
MNQKTDAKRMFFLCHLEYLLKQNRANHIKPNYTKSSVLCAAAPVSGGYCTTGKQPDGRPMLLVGAPCRAATIH